MSFEKINKLVVIFGGLFILLATIDGHSRGNGYGGSDPVMTFLIGVVGVIFSYLFLFASYDGWNKRKNGHKEETDTKERNGIFLAMIGYFIASLFLSMPFLYVVKIIYGFIGYEKHLYLLCTLVIVFIILITYLRRSNLK